MDNDLLTKQFIYMSEGNPGALMAIMEISKVSEGFFSILYCNRMGIKGEKFYMLFNDCCERNIDKYLITIKLFELGVLTKKQIFDNLNMVRAIPFINSDIKYSEFINKSSSEKQDFFEKEKKNYLERIEPILLSEEQFTKH